MGSKNQGVITFNWQSTNPITGFLPLKANQSGTPPSGTLAGAMASTNVIYSQIVELSRMDVLGLDVSWTGTPTGTLEVLVSVLGSTFTPLTFTPALDQPAGSASSIYINIKSMGFKYAFLRYTNASGSGSLTVGGQQKDWN